MDIVARLIAFRDYLGLTNSQFADRAGISRPTLSQFLSGRNKRLSDEFVGKLHQAYPELNVMWLLFSEGDMLADSNIEFSEAENSPILADSSIIDVDNESIVRSEDNVIYGSAQYQSTSQQAAAPQAAIKSGLRQSQPVAETTVKETPSAAAAATIQAERRIKSIMVFYTDNSYEIFTPAASGHS